MTESGERRKQFEKWVESQDEAWGNTFRSSEGWMWEAWRAAFEAGRGGWVSADTLLQHRFFSTQCECGGQRGIGWPMYVAHVKSLPAPPDSGDAQEEK